MLLDGVPACLQAKTLNEFEFELSEMERLVGRIWRDGFFFSRCGGLIVIIYQFYAHLFSGQKYDRH